MEGINREFKLPSDMLLHCRVRFEEKNHRFGISALAP
jgi:hypothetical protein